MIDKINLDHNIERWFRIIVALDLQGSILLLFMIITLRQSELFKTLFFIPFRAGNIVSISN